jgi:outer membrane protein
MKRTLLVLVLTIAALGAAYGQKGSWYITTSGMVSDDNPFSTGLLFGKTTIGEVKCDVMTFGIAPDAGYFITNKFSVGLGLAFNYAIVDPDFAGIDSENTTTFGINPYVRWYPYNENKASFYLQGGFSFVTQSFSTEDVDAINSFSIGVNPGIAYSFNKHFGINAAYGFLGYESVGKDDSAFGLNLKLNTLKFGLSYTF